MLSEIKKEFFTFRNGIVADALRKGGMPYSVIFGLQVPQIANISKKLPQSMELADELWSDRNVRESRILAAYIFPPDNLDMEKALSLARDVQTQEEADMLAFRIFKRLPFAAELLNGMKSDPAVPAEAIKSLENHLN